MREGEREGWAVGAEGQLSVEKTNTMTDNVRVVAPSSRTAEPKLRGERLMHLKRDFWPFAFQPPLPSFFAPSLWSV